MGEGWRALSDPEVKGRGAKYPQPTPVRADRVMARSGGGRVGHEGARGGQGFLSGAYCGGARVNGTTATLGTLGDPVGASPDTVVGEVVG